MIHLQTPDEAMAWLRERGAIDLRPDSRQVRPGDAFIAWPGAATDGRRHVAAALKQGALAALVEREGVEGFDWPADSPVAALPGLKAATGALASEWFGRPSDQLEVMAVTGTNGKTSTAWWLAQALEALAEPWRRPCGLVGTLGIGRLGQTGLAGLVGTGMTTPDPVLLQRHFRQFVSQGVKACAIEASSIGLAEHRLTGTQISLAIFTNFTQDHLDYHGTMQAYRQAKEALFQWPGLRTAVVNLDDEVGAELANACQGRLDVWTVSIRQPARLRAARIQHTGRGVSFEVQEAGGDALMVESELLGLYNISNLLGVMASLRSLGAPLQAVVDACRQLTPVPGRMDCRGGTSKPLVVVDYAHTPDALGKVLEALAPVARRRGGRVCCVFGCGGDRDASKRPLMAAVAEAHSDLVVVTSDNPRSEKPELIVSQILLGLSHRSCVHVEVDRAKAIQAAIAQAQVSDVVLVAGKGHETYQEVAGVRQPFSDMLCVERALDAWGGASA